MCRVYEALQNAEQHWAEEIAHLRELNRIRNKLAHPASMAGEVTADNKNRGFLRL